ncbi:hypothetical protein R69927_03267 [Paraburkholderia domus]|jgi:hypothetical protein|uniref:Uncharacterized protein n=1 Tax=Paraburkholderia domus TaxID=2793075 RepID=A0A9N8MUJ6_9BURK|nr:hypothetical protein [Paraburkholderia domus]MBK5047151.1 hypothetical protein [Burkholderia sp. R-70006]MBK5059060.1 hypothetical protein [Burkholderia sp. R-70199]MBK5086074.1 hypothetical protein [Burkholderia sp. R-69927]MBK5119101.1 hypothetical protein [Burkholderia sp. R-69980]MBK5163144.1 hypothetical protein [Burkholderia sp. R-70211]MBK5178938.1 hypothetical protein [Burkholderia sp. R-69749]MCI0145221.1 hypothetical protein [Paraburkholderia sediminicola]
MADFSCASPQQDATTPDTAVIRVDQLHALAGLLSLEEVAEQFSDLSTVAQVSIFGLFEDALADIRAVLTQTVAMRE